MKSVWVTGASSGIGKAVALLTAKEGWQVFVGYKEGRSRAEEVAQQIRTSGGTAWPIQLDLAKPSDISAALASIAEQTKVLDALVLSAAPTPVLKSFLKTEPGDLNEQLSVNVVGSHGIISQTWKHFFSKQNGGHIIALLSTALGPPPRPHMTAYVTAKQGLATLLECALVELGSSGLRASAISPSYTDTPMLHSFNPHVLESIKASNPKKPFLDPQEVARAVMSCLNNPPSQPILDSHTLQVSSSHV